MKYLTGHLVAGLHLSILRSKYVSIVKVWPAYYTYQTINGQARLFKFIIKSKTRYPQAYIIYIKQTGKCNGN